MNLWEFQLLLKGPFITPWHADILFGHLAWMYRDNHSEDTFLKWLEQFKGANPPFILSDGWIKGSYPRPFLPPNDINLGTKLEKISHAKAGKRLKRTRLLQEDIFKKILTGNNLDSSKVVAEDIFKKRILVKNTIDRDTGTSLEQNGLYELEDNSIESGKIISIFVRADDKSIDLFGDLLKLVSHFGYGKRKSVGYGQFEIVDKIQRQDLDIASDNANGVVWLSHGIPQRDDPVEGWYKLETKYGKLGDRLGSNNYPFKRPFTRILPGSVFKTDKPKPFYGRMLNDVHQYNKSVIQYGLALALPINIPENFLEEQM